MKQLDFDGAFEYSPEVEVAIEMLEQFVLESAFPNPFSSQTTLRFGVREAGPVVATLFNSLGQEVRVLYEATPPRGILQPLTITADDLPSGVYFVRLVGPGFTTTRRLALLR